MLTLHLLVGYQFQKELSKAAHTVAHLRVFFTSDSLWVESHFLCSISLLIDLVVSLWCELNYDCVFTTEDSRAKILAPPPPSVVSATVPSKTVALLLFINCLLLLPFFIFVFNPCFAMQHFVSFLVLQSSRWGKDSWLLCCYCLLNAVSMLSFFSSSPRL